MDSPIEPVRVLHVVSAMNRGGAETLLMNIYRNVDRSKIQFDFVSHLSVPCDYDKEIESLGGRLYHMPSLGKEGPIRYVGGLRKILKDNGPYAAVHAHTDFQSGFVALAAKLAGIERRICHSHNNDWTIGRGLKARAALALLRSMIRAFGTRYCACSEEAAKFLFSVRSIASGKVDVLKNGIEMSKYTDLGNDRQSDVRREFGIPADARIIGHIGRFYEQKNHSFLLKIIKQMADRGIHFTAILVGDGPLKRNIEEEARRQGLERFIRFAGVRSDIPRLMRSFDAFVFPSLFEGFGIVMVEAQAAGTPCIAADTVPADTDMGLGLVTYVSLNDTIERWADEILRAASSVRPETGLVARRIQTNGFDIKENVPQWISLYGFG